MTRPLRSLALLVALAGHGCLPGCLPFGGGGTTVVCSGGGARPMGPGGFAPLEPVYYANRPLSLEVAFDPAVLCSGQSTPTVTSVTVEVFDPDNRRVDAAATPVVRRTGANGGEAWHTAVSFAAGGAGQYHLIATFEPGVGLVQREVWVVNDHRFDAPEQEVLLPAQRCEHAERTRLGAWVCQAPYGGGATVFRDGAQVASWSFGAAHASGDTIWVQAGVGGLSRNLDTGTGPPQLSATARVELLEAAFAATEQHALVRTAGGLRRYSDAALDGGSLATTSDLVLDLAVTVTALALSPDGGAAVLSGFDRWARLELPSGSSRPTLDWKQGEAALFQAPDGLWVQVDPSTMRFVPADPALPMITLIAPPGWRSATSSTQRVLPGERPLLFPLMRADFEALDRTQALVPTWIGTTVQLSHFAAPADAGFAELSSGRLRAMRGDRALFFLVPP